MTLDTTRADAVEPEAPAGTTPHFAGLAARGLRFLEAQATAPETLPSHASMLTGLYPAGHGVHENARVLPARHRALAEELAAAGYATAAFVSAFPLDRQFGLARGFEVYDDDFGRGANGEEAAERRAAATTTAALAWLARPEQRPRFLWVHYYDAHDPYDPPEPFRSRYPDDPYRGEVASVDEQLGRLLDAFAVAVTARPHAVVVTADHGEGLGEHGEALHGNLLYRGVMRVPLVIAGTGIEPGVVEEPVSLRLIRATLLGRARGEAAPGLLDAAARTEVVLGEAMKPYLAYGWQPQVMALAAHRKLIRAGEVHELYDLLEDPAEQRNLAGGERVAAPLAAAARDYPLPGAAAAAPAELDADEERRLASLGYLASSVEPVRRPGAPLPREMTGIFAALDTASTLFVQGEYGAAATAFAKLEQRDPGNLMVVLRRAVALSLSGRVAEAEPVFERARDLAPESADVVVYTGLHALRRGQWERAAVLLGPVVAASPERLPAVEGLVRALDELGRRGEALRVLETAVPAAADPTPLLLRLGLLHMQGGETELAIAALERARARRGEGFPALLELGVLYQAAGRLAEAAATLDAVPADHPAYPLALFKRAQVAVLLGESDRAARIENARRVADATTRPLIAAESLFREVPAP